MTELVEAAHSIFSASGSSRWLACPGSIWLSKGIYEPSSKYAMAGSAAHYVSECIQRDGMSDDEAITALSEEHPKWYQIFLKEDRADFFNSVYVYVNWMRDKIEANPTATAMYEQRVRLGFIHPMMYGTADFLQFELFLDLESCDFKHGKGVAVDVAKGDKVEDANSQQAYYLLGAAHRYDYNFEKVHMTVAQPRAPHVEGTIRTRTYDMEEFREVWTEKFTRGVTHVMEAKDAPKLDAYLMDGDHCGFCPAKGICPKIRAKTYDIARMDFEPITAKPIAITYDDDGKVPERTLPNPASLNQSELIMVLQHSKLIDGWIKGVNAHAEQLLESDEPLKLLRKHFKIVQTRPTRQWIDPKKVLASLKRRKNLPVENYLTEPKLLSPNQIQTKNKKDNPKLWESLQKHIHKVSGGRTMAPEDDKRPALEHQKAKDDFDAIE